MRYRATAALACIAAALALPAVADTAATGSAVSVRPDGAAAQYVASDGHWEITQIDGVKGTVAKDGGSKFVPVNCGTPQLVGTERGRVECRKTREGYFSFVPVQVTYACTVAPTARRFITSFEPVGMKCDASQYKNSSADAQQAWGETWPSAQSPVRATAVAAVAAPQPTAEPAVDPTPAKPRRPPQQAKVKPTVTPSAGRQADATPDRRRVADAQPAAAADQIDDAPQPQDVPVRRRATASDAPARALAGDPGSRHQAKPAGATVQVDSGAWMMPRRPPQRDRVAAITAVPDQRASAGSFGNDDADGSSGSMGGRRNF